MQKYWLLKAHMNCNPEYIFGHAIMAGKLATKGIKTLEEYKAFAQFQGIEYYPGGWDEWAKEMQLTS